MRLRPIIQHCVVAGLLVLPVPSWAVGLGRLTLQSGLGQALAAEIELTSVQPGELDTLSARLADQATYSNNKIDYGSALARVRVVLDQRDGRPVLKVSSTQPVNEPFLDLLIELNWATGRLLREYTFLLDPPGFAATTAVEPAAAIPAQSLAPAAPPAERSAAPAPAAAPSAPAAPAAVPSAAAQASGANNYGPVKRGETLGKIAAQVKPEGVTLEQMLTALYRANAQAFDGKNMSRLRAGQILTVPKSEEAAAVPNNEAKKEIRVQAADWRAYRDRLAGAVSGGEAQGARQVASGRITTAVEDKVAAAPGADKLRLSKGETVPGTTGAAGRAENALASQKAVAEANSRVVALEKQVKDLQRLLELKNSSLQAQQLAVEQARAAAKGAGATAPASPAAATPATPAAPAAPTQTIFPTPAAPAAATPPPVPVTVTSAGELAKAEAAKAPTLAAADPSTAAPPKSETKDADADAAAAKAELPKSKPPLRPSQPQPEPSFLDDLLSNTYVLVGGTAVIVLGFVAWLLARRRRSVTTKFEDSIGAGTDIRTSTVFGNTGGGVVNTGDNSLVSDFSREGLGNIDTGEVDPIAEAEVYLAYGRDNQAEEILRDALGKTPDRQEIRLKLLEIYAQQNKPTAFETIAAEVFAATKGSGDVWAKAAQLGRGIDPANPLYAAKGEEAGAGSAAPPPTVLASGDDRLPDSNMRVAAAVEKSAFETDFELPEAPKREVFVMPPALTPPEPAAAVGVPGTSSLSAPLAAAAAASVAAAAASRATAVHDRAPLDFKLDSGPDMAPHLASPTMDFVTLDGPITLTGATTLSGPSTLSDVTLAAPFGGIWGEQPLAPLHETLNVAPPVQTDKLRELKPSDVIMPAVAAAVAAGTVSMASFSPMTTSTVTRAPQPSGKLDLDKLDLSFDPSRKTFEEQTPTVLDGQWHDAATKLDLAKAYQEMGDVEGAREILQEVMQEGDEQQKKEAHVFLTKLRS
jgi:pilus assembly protein FimV